MEDSAELIPILQETLSNLLNNKVPVSQATARVATMRFTQLIEKEFRSFLASPEPPAADFEDRIEILQERVRAEMREVWAGKEVGFKEPDGVDTALVRLANAAVLKARHLSNRRGRGADRSETSEHGERTIGDLRSSRGSSPINEADKFAELGGAETAEARSRTLTPTPVKGDSSGAPTMSDETPSAPHRKRGFPADDEGHLRVAELLPSDWQKDLPGALKRLANPQDGGLSVKLSRAWEKKYQITSYAEVGSRIGDKEIIQHLERRRKLGIDLRNGVKSRKVSESLGQP